MSVQAQDGDRRTDSDKTRKTRLGVVSLVVVAAIVGGYALWLSPLGSGPRCWVELRDSEIIELPGGEVTLEQYSSDVATASGGCATVTVRSGPDDPDSIVLSPSGGRYEINNYLREVFVETAAE